MSNTVYLVEIVSRTTVEVTDCEDYHEAEQAVKEMYECGDACASLGETTFTAIERHVLRQRDR